MKRIFSCKIILFLFLPFILWGQGAYYNSVDTGSVNFVTNLHNLINPHTKITYNNFDETNIANFASRDTTVGQKVVTCVYSGENYVYTPPFTYAVFSREHTWCHSWMPSNPADSPERDEYSDQHHLFPTNQNNANARRSNHPLGEVTAVSYQFLEGKLGTNSLGQIVYEPRESHKGDAARALLYMAVCYNGVNGKDWTFNYLNTVTLPESLNEASQDVDLLIQWHTQDPPDQWEKDRNEYIYSIQGNRNPFIDHPEYVNVIDFNTLTKKTTVTLAIEPTNYPTNYFQGTITSSSIQLTWTKSIAGSQAPSGYLMIASTSSSITSPADGVVYTDDSNLSDNSAMVNLSSTDSTYTFSGLPSASTYYFKLFPFNGTGSSRNYKTDGSPPTQFGLTLGSGAATPSVVVNEYLNGSAQSSEWVELLVIQDNLDMRGMKLRDYSAAGSAQSPIVFATNSVWSSVQKGTIIVISANGNTQTQDTSFSDKVVVLSNANSTYFSSGSTSFNIGGSADAVEILASDNTTHIHSLSHGSYPELISTIPQPRANAIGASTSGNVVRFINISSVSQFADTTHTQQSSTATMGTPNDATQTNFVNTVLPVELVSFSAAVTNSNVLLQWETATELNNYGFEIEKSRSQKSEDRSQKTTDTWNNVGFVEGSGTSNTSKEYSFLEKNLSAGKYSYRLKQIDRDGKFVYSQSVEVEVGTAPLKFELAQNYPNPFNPSTVINFKIPAVTHVSLKVFDAIGREVVTLVDEIKEAGSYSVTFSAERGSASGGDATALSSGLYFARLQSGKNIETKRMLLIK